jgi:uncharacterized protein YjeT (DUF2065 family)
MGYFFTSLLTALGLMLIIEGLVPFIAPERWKRLFKAIVELPVEQLRIMGLGAIIAGLVLLWIAL